MQNSLAYATRVRTIKNDVTKMEASKEMIRLKKQVGPAGSARGNKPKVLYIAEAENIAGTARCPGSRNSAGA